MPKQVTHIRNGDVANVLGESGDFYWLSSSSSVRPWTAPKYLWEEPKPKSGDVWEAKSGRAEYRVLGVDEVNNTYLIVRKEKYHGGRWPTPDGGRQIDAETTQVNYIHVRALPEAFLNLKSRLGSEGAE